MKECTIGVDLGGTNTRIAVVKAGGHIVKRREFSTKGYKTRNRLINAISGAITGIIDSQNIRPQQILGIGIGAPGLVDSKKGIVHFLTNVPGWKDVNLKSILQDKLGLPVYIDNDANLMALAESRFGAAKGSKYAVCITLGTGVGGGLIINGELYRGFTQSAGEIGHVPICLRGAMCNCGNRGCLEAYVGNKYIIKRAIYAARKDKSSILKGLAGGNLNKITPQLITEAAKKGDRLAIDLWRQAAEYLGAGLVFIVNVLDPEVIVVGGGVAGSGRFILDPLKAYVKKAIAGGPARAVRIVMAKLGNDAGLIGAAELARG